MSAVFEFVRLAHAVPVPPAIPTHGRVFHLPGLHNQKLHGGGHDLGIGPLDGVDLDKLHAITTGKNKAALQAALIDAGLDETFLKGLSAKEQYDVLKAGKKTTSDDLAKALAAQHAPPKTTHPLAGDVTNVDYAKVSAITTGKNKAALKAALVDAGVDAAELDKLTASQQYQVLKDLKKGPVNAGNAISPTPNLSTPKPASGPDFSGTPASNVDYKIWAASGASATYVQNTKSMKNIDTDLLAKATPGSALDANATSVLHKAGVDKNWVADATPFDKASMLDSLKNGDMGQTSWKPGSIADMKGKAATHSSAPGVDIYKAKKMINQGNISGLKTQLAGVGVDKQWIQGATDTEILDTYSYLKGLPVYTPPVKSGAGVPVSTAAVVPKVSPGAPSLSHVPANFVNNPAPGKFTTAANAWKASLEYHEDMAVKAYTGSTYKALNDGFRKKGGVSSQYKKTADNLDSALSKGSTPEDRLLFRGSYMTDAQVKMGVGSTITDKGYGSTSTDRNVAQGFVKTHSSTHGKVTPTIFRIQAKKGTPGGLAHTTSSHKKEKEFILPRGAQYKILGMTMPPNGANYGFPMYVDVELVGFDPD